MTIKITMDRGEMRIPVGIGRNMRCTVAEAREFAAALQAACDDVDPPAQPAPTPQRTDAGGVRLTSAQAARIQEIVADEYQRTAGGASDAEFQTDAFAAKLDALHELVEALEPEASPAPTQAAQHNAQSAGFCSHVFHPLDAPCSKCGAYFSEFPSDEVPAKSAGVERLP